MLPEGNLYSTVSKEEHFASCLSESTNNPFFSFSVIFRPLVRAIIIGKQPFIQALFFLMFVLMEG